MRIVDLRSFLEMAPGTVFAKYQPCCFEGLHIKGDSIPASHDFFYQQIADALDVDDSGEFVNKLKESQERGTSVALDFETESRDGCFDAGQLFAVWESADVRQLIARLQKCVTSPEPETPEFPE